jgi:hypothetical protein
MSKISLSGNPSGTGTVTIAAPNTNSDVTLSLPAVSAELITNSSGVLNIGSGQVYKDASGNVGVGTTSPAFPLSIFRGAGQAGYAEFVGNGQTAAAFLVGQDAAGLARIFQNGANPITFWTNGSERARIDSSGNLLVGTTSAFVYSAGADLGLNFTSEGRIYTNSAVTHVFNLTSAAQLMQFRVGGATQVGGITLTASSTSYNTSSDYRLKENVAPMTGALEKVAQLKPCTYTWKSDGSAGQGFIAHELQAVVPDCVTGEKDAVERLGNILDADGSVLQESVQEPTEDARIDGQTWIHVKDEPRYQGVDTSFLVATLVAAIQEQQTLIADLTTRLEALEAI